MARERAEPSTSVDQLASDRPRTSLTFEDGETVVVLQDSSGFPVIHVPPGTPQIALDAVREAEEEDDLARLGWPRA